MCTVTCLATRLLLALTAATTIVGCAAAQRCTPRPVPPPVAATDYLARTGYEACWGEGPFKGASALLRYTDAPDSIRHPERIISGRGTGLCWPGVIALGPRGELYVLNHAPWSSSREPRAGRWTTWVTVYDSSARGAAAPIRVLDLGTRGFGNPSSFAVDREGYLYVGSTVDRLLDAGSVAVFAPGADGDVEPVRVLAGPATGLRRPVALALDRRGELYVTNEPDRLDDTVRVFTAESAGEVEPCRVIAGARTGLQRPIALAVDRKSRLYVADAGGPGSLRRDAVYVYDAGAGGDTAPNRTFAAAGIYDRMRQPRRLALDSHDSLYVRSAVNLTVFGTGPADTARPARSFFRDAPDLFALDRHDTLYTVSNDTVRVFPPSYSGGGFPLRELGGPNTGIHGVTGIALDRRGRLYLAIGKESVIRVYPPGAKGDIAPERTLSGPRTGIIQPRGIALDRADRLYVTNAARPGGGSAIRVYAPGARGQDLPVRILRGAATRLSGPVDIEFDSRGDLHVAGSAEDGTGMITVFRRQAAGNEAPLRAVTGALTLLRRPVALAFGRADTLYALNAFGFWRSRCGFIAGGGHVTVTAYPPGASGEVEPAHTLVLAQDGRSPGRGLGMPRGLAVDSTGAVQVWHPGGAVLYAPEPEGEAVPIRATIETRPDGMGPSGVMVGPDGSLWESGVPSPERMFC
jgi:sugar lactone lactonase YvrE